MNTELLDLIKERRTVRKFTDQEVADEQLRAVLEAAASAPTRHADPPWHFVILRDKTLQKQVRDTLRTGPFLETAPVVVAVWAEPARSPTWLLDCSAAIQNLLLAAHAVGLGGVWVGGPGEVVWERAEEALRQAVGAPEETRLVSLVALGIPARAPEPHGEEAWDHRRVHRGRWGAYWE